MTCQICGSENSHRAKKCQSCGSNLNTRGGADITFDDSGNANHAGNSRWKSGAGMAGGGALLGLAKVGVLFKLFILFRPVHEMTLGTTGLIFGLIGLAVMAAFGFRRYIRNGSIF